MIKQTNFLTFDVLARGPLRALVRWSGFPVVFQMISLGGVAALAANGLGHGTDMKPDELMSFRKTNLTTLFVWGLWWPGMVALALAFGRAWCTVCPMELVNRIGDTLARKVSWPRVRMGRLLRAGWITLLLYLAMQLMVSGISIHRVPHFTSILLLALFGLALATGMAFRRPRSFCLGFCPASALLSVYGRFTPLKLSEKAPAICDDCKTRDCVKKTNRFRFDRRSCPSLLQPFSREPSDACVLCLQCVKVCPSDNMGLGVVSQDASVRKKGLLRPFEATFVMLALGFVAHEVIGEVKWLDRYFHWLPDQAHAVFPTVPFGWLEAAWFLVVFPLAVWAVVAVASRVLGHQTGARSLLLSAATGAAPVVAVAHLAKAVAKLSSWGGYLPAALRDPAGEETFRAIANQTLASPDRLVDLSLLGWVMLAGIVIVGWRAWRWAGALPAESVPAARASFLMTAVLFASVLVVWTFPPQ